MDLGDEKTPLEAGELFEENWFFGNLFKPKTTSMSRCFSDPCPTSKTSTRVQGIFNVGQSYEETFSSIKKTVLEKNGDEFSHRSLIKAPSMPTNVSSSSSSMLSPENDRFCKFLQRTPSLPFDIRDNEDDEDEESEFSMGKLIRQASLGRSNMLPPRRFTTIATPKIAIPTIVPRHRPRKKQDQEIKAKGLSDERKKQHVPVNQTKQENNLANSESELVNGFKELNLKSNKIELKPGIISITPDSQEKNKNTEGENKTRRSYARNSMSPTTRNNGGKKSAEDMKAQIKYWARAVASNVRQEC